MRKTVVHLGLLGLGIVACSSAEVPPDGSDDVVIGPTLSAQPRDVAPTVKVGTTLIAVGSEPAGANCAAGGTALRSGSDANKDGVLQSREVARVDYVCNGTNGKTPVLKTTAEPIGTRCPTGGQGISWGYDDNANGSLDPTELKQSAYVCNGVNGTNGVNGQIGQNGLNGLVTVMDIAPGDPRCGASGGRGIYTGLDASRDGLLQPGEVQGSSFVCNGANGANGTGALVNQTTVPAGANCATGGVRIDSGSDANASGVLDVSEITKTSYVCHGAQGATGASGLDSLVRVTAEPAGASCANGGQRIETGLDANRSGALDASEIVNTTFACNGTNGANGTNGLTTLVRQAAEAAGTNCAVGGTELGTGLDANNDGVLQDSEVLRTSYLCNGQPGPTGPAGANGKTTLVKVTPEAVGANCGSGGQRIDVGTDANANTVLDASEITQTRYVCNGQNGAGLGVVVRTTTRRLSAGDAQCPLGGDIIDAGPDVNQNGLLESAEVASSVRMCWLAEGGPSPSSTCNLAVALDHNLNGEIDTAERENLLLCPQADPTRLSAGGNASCAVVTDGYGVLDPSLWCWGDTVDAQLTELGTFMRPRPVGGIPVGPVAMGDGFACFVTAGSHVRCTGRNDLGQLGNNAAADGGPPLVPGAYGTLTPMTGVAQVAAGESHACAVLTDGTVWCWGANDHRQTGNAWSGSPTLRPEQVSGTHDGALAGVLNVAPGGDHSCAFLSDHTVSCWGENALGQLGRGYASSSIRTADSVLLPSFLGSSTYSYVVSGGSHSCVVGASSTGSTFVYCWGDNALGQLGSALVPPPPSSSTPLFISVPDVTQLVAGHTHTAALSFGQVRRWGRLGASGTVFMKPTLVLTSGSSSSFGGAPPSALVSGLGHLCATTSANLLFCWGDAASGQLYSGAGPVPSPTRIAIP